MREAMIVRGIRRRLRHDHGILTARLGGDSRQAGWPDLLAVVPTTTTVNTEGYDKPIYSYTRHVYLEVKTKTGKLRANQVAMIEQLTKRGCEVHVVRSIQEGVEAVIGRDSE